MIQSHFILVVPSTLLCKPDEHLFIDKESGLLSVTIVLPRDPANFPCSTCAVLSVTVSHTATKQLSLFHVATCSWRVEGNSP